MASASNNNEGENTISNPPPFVVPSHDWKLFRNLPTFDLRNGDPSDVTSIELATMSLAYHWVPVGNLTAANASMAIHGYIRSHLVHMTDNNPSNVAANLIRKAAIVLGTIRAVSTTFYGLEAADLIADELSAPLINGCVDGDGNVSYTVATGYTGKHEAMLIENLAFTDVETAVIRTLIKCAAGVIPMQGYSLMMTNQNYLSTAESQSRKVFSVAEKAYWKANDVATWFTNDLAMIQDMAWHKATHPVKIHIKISTAMQPDINVKLAAAGAGACASRLPAMEPELRAAKSYVALFSKVAPMFRMFGGDVDVHVLVDLITLVQLYPPGVENPVRPKDAPTIKGAVITNRYNALTTLNSVLKRNADSAAYCYGFYTALSDSSITLGGAGGTTQDTLKTSYSLSKLKTQNYASYVAGTEAFGDYQAAKNLRCQNGDCAP